MSESLQDILMDSRIAMLVAIVARRVSLPYTVGLVVIGGLLAFSKSMSGRDLPPN